MATRPADDADRPKFSYSVLIANGLLIVLFISVVLGFSEEKHILDLLLHIQLGWIAFAALLQLATYFFSGGAWEVILRQFTSEVTLGEVAKLGIEKLFLDQMIPTLGLGGNLMMVRSLEQRKIRRHEAIAAMLIDSLSYLGSYLILFALAAVVLWYEVGISLVIRYLVLAIFVVLLFPISMVFFLMRRTRTSSLPAWMSRFKPTRALAEALNEAPKEIFKIQRAWLWSLLCEVAVFVLDIATLWAVFRALGVALSAPQALVSFMLASAVSTLSVIPGGLGFFEGGAIIVLNSFGISLGTAATGVILLRLFTYWLPMIPGYLIFRSEMVARPGAHH
ncbi:MAG: lysylphosphatidylglycerol synthase transmembrane domain-containing protein [Candidatus Pacebacteria bacterium]|nr:lysylphosphatidylglycerol synthase transmembrane domain-containing protein [Candidatus Paceibacterota bacterium]